jgi:endonuclease/exonuclease/phosphatase family metal-dependent hydrolase
MGGGRYRDLRRSAAVVFFLASAALLLAGSTAAGGATRPVFRVLQLNLCNSGLAGCFTGRSVDAAAAIIRARRPDVVALNEVCRDDVYGLRESLQGLYGGSLAWAFKAAEDRPTASDFRCRNGQPYGIGLLVRLPAPLGYTVDAGIYPAQDPRDPEERAWLCLHATGTFLACTTHLASTSAPVSLAQCHYLLDTAIPAIRAAAGEPTVVAGDFNLGHGAFNVGRTGVADVATCVPPGYLREDDGAVQQVLAATGFAVEEVELIDMHATTDHLGLLVTFTTSGLA